MTDSSLLKKGSEQDLCRFGPSKRRNFLKTGRAIAGAPYMLLFLCWNLKVYIVIVVLDSWVQLSKQCLSRRIASIGNTSTTYLVKRGLLLQNYAHLNWDEWEFVYKSRYYSDVAVDKLELTRVNVTPGCCVCDFPLYYYFFLLLNLELVPRFDLTLVLSWFTLPTECGRKYTIDLIPCSSWISDRGYVALWQSAIFFFCLIPWHRGLSCFQ